MGVFNFVKQNWFFLAFCRKEWIDCTVHQTSHREDADQEAGQCHLKQLLFLNSSRKSSLAEWHPNSTAPSPPTHLAPVLGKLEMTIDLGLRPNARMLLDQVSVLFLHHLMDLVLVRRGKKLGNMGIWMGDWDGMDEGFGTLSAQWHLIWKDWCMSSDGCEEKGPC